MRALTLWQPWASLCALGVKTIETRSWPAPKALIGQRIALHAAKRRPKVGDPAAPWQALAAPINGGLKREIPTLPYGAVVGTAVLTDCVPMVEVAADPPCNHLTIGWRSQGQVGLRLWRYAPEGERRMWQPYHALGNGTPTDVSDQLPFGDFRPGRWAWLLADAEPCEPVPAVGRQGVWRWEP